MVFVVGPKENAPRYELSAGRGSEALEKSFGAILLVDYSSRLLVADNFTPIGLGDALEHFKWRVKHRSNATKIIFALNLPAGSEAAKNFSVFFIYLVLSQQIVDERGKC